MKFSSLSSAIDRIRRYDMLLLWSVVSLIFFYAGIKLKIYSVLLGIFLLCSTYCKSYVDQVTNVFSRKTTIFLTATIAIFPVIAFFLQMARIRLSNQGVDFAIYAQALDRFVNYGALESSLFGLKYYDFLTHHFSPYLFFLGLIAKIFASASVSLLFVHSVCIVLTLIAIFKLFSLNKAIDPSSAFGLTVLFILLPNARVAILWGVHDETYALPFILWALYALITKKLRLLVLSLVLLCTVKETMFLVLTVFGVAGLSMYRDTFSGLSAKVTKILFVTFIVSGVLGFVLYTKVLPGRLFTPSFSGFARVVSWDQLISTEILWKKLWWIMVTLLPVLPLLTYPGESWRNIKRRLGVFIFYSFPAFPFIAAILISNFEEMYKPYNYYSIIPATVVFCAACLSYRNSKIPKKLILLSLCLATILGPNVKLLSEFRRSVRIGDQALRTVRSVVPKDSVVIVADYEAIVFVDYKQIMRLFHANKETPRFDYIVQNKLHQERLSLYLRSWSEIVFEDSNWLVRRALPSARVL